MIDQAYAMNSELRPIESVRSYEPISNDNDAALDAIEARLSELGFHQPIIVDATGVIVLGRPRWKAAKKLGLTHVPVHVAVEMTPDEYSGH